MDGQFLLAGIGLNILRSAYRQEIFLQFFVCLEHTDSGFLAAEIVINDGYSIIGLSIQDFIIEGFNGAYGYTT